MAKVKVVCTSTGAIGFAPERYQGHDIDTLFVHMEFQGKEYLEGVDLDPVEFYAALATLKEPRKNLPKTWMPTRAEIQACFDSAIENGYEAILVYTLSKGLSGTYSVASALAKEYADRIKIYVIDTNSAAFAEGIHAVRAAEMLEAGRSVEEVVAESYWAIAHQEFIAIDGKLDYLVYNGRLKGAKAFMGKLLNICPVLHFNEEGDLCAMESIRTPKKALARVCELIKQKIGDRDPADYFLYHIYTGPSMLAELIEIEKKFDIQTNHEDVIMTPTSGCHNGPWLAGYGYYCIRRNDEAL